MQELSSRRTTFLSFQPPAVGDEEIEAVAETLRSGWLTTGPRAAELERRIAEMVGAKHAVAVSSGTAAIQLALVALGIGPDDEVITSPITWPATANVVVHAGARPVFVDVRDSDLNIDPAEVVKAVTPRTKAILPVDLAGQPAALDWSAVPQPPDRLGRARNLLLALRNEERRCWRGRRRDDGRRRCRRRAAGAPPHAPR